MRVEELIATLKKEREDWRTGALALEAERDSLAESVARLTRERDEARGILKAAGDALHVSVDIPQDLITHIRLLTDERDQALAELSGKREAFAKGNAALPPFFAKWKEAERERDEAKAELEKTRETFRDTFQERDRFLAELTRLREQVRAGEFREKHLTEKYEQHPEARLTAEAESTALREQVGRLEAELLKSSQASSKLVAPAAALGTKEEGNAECLCCHAFERHVGRGRCTIPECNCERYDADTSRKDGGGR